MKNKNKWLIIYASLTGNTEQIANALYEAFNEDTALTSDETKVEIYAIDKIDNDFNFDEYENIAIGYWLTRGGPEEKVQKILQKLHDKFIIFFQTHGAKVNTEHSVTAFARAATYLGKNCYIVGTFASQGKIDPKLLVRKRNTDPNDPHSATEQNQKRWEEAAMHPNQEDFLRVKEFVKAMKHKLALREKYLTKNKSI